MNNVVLIGRLTRDPDLRYTQSQRPVCTLFLAVDRGYSRQKRAEMESQNQPTADFPRITIWGVQAENASRYLRKSSQCAVIGRIQTGSYKDNNGNTVYTTEVVADRVEFLSSNNQGGTSYQNNSYNSDNFNQDTYPQNFNQQRNYNNQAPNNNDDDDFFDDDFEELQDDGKIPF
ncbi:MAG: single-stranded DNA-binding protein [Tissierellia bacterium]|nr:single-stranded DNA-binding protein [Tissierellia bacterium]